MISKVKVGWLYGASLFFIILNCILFSLDFLWLSALPASLLLLLLVFLRFDIFLLSVVFLVPLSINIEDIGGASYAISIPSEPLILVLMLLSIFKLLIEGKYDRRIIKHPISIAILFYIGWMIITTGTSTMPFISLKFLVAHLWFILTFYFVAALLFKKIENITRFIWLFAIPLAGVVAFTLIKHQAESFSHDAAYEVMAPFFTDHGIYAVVVAFFIPPMVGFAFWGDHMKIHPWLRILALTIVGILVIGIVFSFTRAAWVSLAAAAGALVLFLFRIRLIYILTSLLLIGSIYFQYQDDITYLMSKNEQDTDEGFDKQIESIYNISTDMSNLERINRWESAWNMFLDKPFWGFGPGTYESQYAPYQNPDHLTPISTNFGDGGNSHSEYLNPLAESGVLGLVSLLSVILLTVGTGMNLMYKAKLKRVRVLAGSIILALITYYVHGFLNNYSHIDKAAVPIWGFIAMIAALDVYHRKTTSQHETLPEETQSSTSA